MRARELALRDLIWFLENQHPLPPPRLRPEHLGAAMPPPGGCAELLHVEFLSTLTPPFAGWFNGSHGQSSRNLRKAPVGRILRIPST